MGKNKLKIIALALGSTMFLTACMSQASAAEEQIQLESINTEHIADNNDNITSAKKALDEALKLFDEVWTEANEIRELHEAAEAWWEAIPNTPNTVALESGIFPPQYTIVDGEVFATVSSTFDNTGRFHQRATQESKGRYIINPFTNEFDIWTDPPGILNLLQRGSQASEFHNSTQNSWHFQNIDTSPNAEEEMHVLATRYNEQSQLLQETFTLARKSIKPTPVNAQDYPWITYGTPEYEARRQAEVIIMPNFRSAAHDWWCITLLPGRFLIDELFSMSQVQEKFETRRNLNVQALAQDENVSLAGIGSAIMCIARGTSEIIYETFGPISDERLLQLQVGGWRLPTDFDVIR